MMTGGIWLLPLFYALAFVAAMIVQRQHWRIAQSGALAALAVVLALSVVDAGYAVAGQPALNGVVWIMAVLVALLGWVIVRYSQRYMEGEPDQPRFVRAMLFTLAAVSLLVASDNLLVMVLAWTATSIGLHYLLTHYRERKAAQIVAHKKFIVSRMADGCLAIALLLVYLAVDSFSLQALSAHLQGAEALTPQLHVAAVLVVLAAVLKSAQLPLHGWLIQVMEAPTPVSALLHAGIVNIGGFVLIRLADLIALAPLAQILLVVVGSLTAVLAGLVMLTRISIKVRLAWSTCAQMGFMLLEIGLGLYELALLHLVAHSLYKGYAFLSAGDVVSAVRLRDLESATQPVGLAVLPRYVVSALGVMAIVFTSAWVWQWFLPQLAIPQAALWIVALGLAPLLWLEHNASPALFVRGLGQIAGLTQLYFVWHVLFGWMAPAPAEPMTALVVWVVVCFIALYGIQIWLRSHPDGRFSRTFYPWAYNGFYLDESFTRITFGLWPIRFTAVQARTLVNGHPNATGEMA